VACQVLAGLTSVDETLALIAGATGLVSNDTGWLQLGAATGVPLVGLFGSTSPDQVAPLPLRARAIRIEPSAGLECAPCGDNTCRPGHLRCLQEVPAARVLDALLNLVRCASADPGGLRLAAVAAQDGTDSPRRVAGAA
jgi:heptosyltransferase-2